MKSGTMATPRGIIDHQAFPREGPLAYNANLELTELRARLAADGGTLYCYVIDTIEEQGGRFVQTGSGPNFQGGLVTLCTCKHNMRTFKSPPEWRGKWIAGFTGVGPGQGHNRLFFLMAVAHAFESHHQLWFSDAIPAETKRAKAAHLDRFGDVYKPRTMAGDPFNPRDYVPPCRDHVHCESSHWHEDIYYVGRITRREAALLVGDPGRSFLWDLCTIWLPSRIPRGQKNIDLTDLLSQLSEDPIIY